MRYKVVLNGKSYEVDVEQGEAVLVGVQEAPAAAPQAPAAPVAAAAPAAPAPSAPAAPSSAVDGEKILAPMPGAVVDVRVSEGASFKKGDVLVVFEAMKMENEVTAARDGTVRQVLVRKGDSINTDDVLLVI